ncbi:(2Fe-2S)-binding protein [Heliophilum fasciatum]|uniref:Bacterioferritin-associated ferredoxin n=1 Tax=Heliophilum fasciatum TaxID=35700 RepID=A0A4R2RCC9_9FIRM|nr:(2Fe-2S)-binding protein [Heliophilum fasciatum]MCW2279172.1 bacterioferritin-associated ferredoxin [Heliophilum fasciatum]TCP61030.1 bacterioferritin-associated ferredoxin [Heliophilum fasciatum]
MDPNEVVCPCMGITYNDLKNAVENGAKSFEEVQEVTEVSTVCDQCEDDVKSIVTQLLK